ncbi:hypothetical protein KIMH_13000 [Bombiscardovia apis]|uniref:FHA domain-containing protein n=1 Tax=Bombiscardovia apis TaxID=2932182 RepID=A0ABM8BE35_9BIFI|nr:FHA domain-containing protein [Bombiscardovia apis]BDR55189.1 hypothetical protein KIMH_13000 [Bombiscardovia apis]
MSDGQRPTRQWVVTINGVEKIRLSPGESIEIGRKPIRPLPDDGMVRLEVQDQTKSMSKRHASFVVEEDGQAHLRDMGSTNGSYVVQADGDLIRLPEDNDYSLQHDSERFQFGDVLVDFTQIEDVEPDADDEPAEQVPDLFSYAQDEDEAAQEPDEADLSVDDILDLRAGEPTGVFHAENVRSRISALHDQVVDLRQQDAAEPIFEQEAVSEEVEQVPVVEEEAQPEVFDGNEPMVEDDVEPQFQPLGAAQLQDEEQERQAAVEEIERSAAEPQSQTYKPAFEPGSVFDKVSKGDFDAQEQVIEVDGMTSDDAKNSTDFALQFEMAKHNQLLPFLAMNPSLYDDLYAWLSAQGNDDIDSALQKNEGYREYLAAQE